VQARAVIFLASIAAVGSWPASAANDTKRWIPDIPKVWDKTALEDWVTPIARLNIRPTHMSEKDYYSVPVYNLRTYPVYFPGREPEGYWEMLQHIGLKPLIEAENLRTRTDWIAAGQRVFDEADTPQLRTFDPKLIGQVRSREFVEGQGAVPLSDGTMDILRWVPTNDGVALSTLNCSGCHVLHTSDGKSIRGAPRLAEMSHTHRPRLRGLRVTGIESANHVLTGAPPFFMGGTFGISLYQAYGVPWLKDDRNEQLKNVTLAEYDALVAANRFAGAITRWNGSLLYPAKIPDLIGLKDRKYIDHTATHLHRGISDLMRYAAQVSFAELIDFGPYHVLTPESKRVDVRLPDEALYALGLYIYSLQPPPNPNPLDENAKTGQQIFVREGCPICHTPPLYTSNKLTLAQGFTPPEDKPPSLDVLPISVGTDPGLALATRKRTGYYKVPSLKGVWYRGHYLHDGSAAKFGRNV
jgi:hypothetical protein